MTPDCKSVGGKGRGGGEDTRDAGPSCLFRNSLVSMTSENGMRLPGGVKSVVMTGVNGNHVLFKLDL